MGVESVDDKGTWSRTVAFLSHPVAVIALSAVVRLVTAVAGWERLNADPDSYRQLAETLAQTGSYSRPDPVDGVLYPTAYRPPLYPLLLACLATQEGVPRLLIVGLHGLLGVGTVALVLHAGRRLGLGRRSAIAGVLTACDPILLHQSTLVMTETLAAFLAASGLACALEAMFSRECSNRSSNRDAGRFTSRFTSRFTRPFTSWKNVDWVAMTWAVASGVMAGMAALCRPTFLPWLPCLAIAVGFARLRLRVGGRARVPGVPTAGGRARMPGPPTAGGLLTAGDHVTAGSLVTAGGLAIAGGNVSEGGTERARDSDGCRFGRTAFGVHALMVASLVLAGGLAVVGLWAARNNQQMGRWIATTTHGGYTLLLGNNPDYYGSLVAPAPDGLPWRLPAEDYLMARCRDSLGPDARAAHDRLRGVARELAEDALANRCARSHIVADPALFVRSSLVRMGQFWSPLPQATTVKEGRAKRAARYAVAAWYLVVGVCAARGTFTWIAAVRRTRLFPFARNGTVRRRVIVRQAVAWSPLVTLILCFAAAHTLYWSNLRMRGPVMPAICLLAAAGAATGSGGGRWRRLTNPEDPRT